jgi:hypothetical protein
MDWTGLKLLLEGIEPARQRKRYRHATRGQEQTIPHADAINCARAERSSDTLAERR